MTVYRVDDAIVQFSLTEQCKRIERIDDTVQLMTDRDGNIDRDATNGKGAFPVTHA